MATILQYCTYDIVLHKELQCKSNQYRYQPKTAPSVHKIQANKLNSTKIIVKKGEY